MSNSVTWREPIGLRHTSGPGSRITGALCAAIFGVILFLGSFALIWWNEGRAVATAESLDEGQNALNMLTSYDAKYINKLVYISDDLHTDRTLEDRDFKIKLDAVHLHREVETYQWTESRSERKETDYDGRESKVVTATYSKSWETNIVPSSSFKDGSHSNPKNHKFAPKSYIANEVKVGSLKLDQVFVDQINDYEVIPISKSMDNDKKSASELKKGGKKSLISRMNVADNYYYSGDVVYPAVGDTRIQFKVAGKLPQSVSVIGKLSRDGSISTYKTLNRNSIAMLHMGEATPQEMFDAARTTNTILRFAGFVAMLIGLSMMTSIVSVLVDWIPIIGPILSFGLGVGNFVVAFALSLITASLAWFAFRPIMSIALIALAAGAIYFKGQNGVSSRVE